MNESIKSISVFVEERFSHYHNEETMSYMEELKKQGADPYILMCLREASYKTGFSDALALASFLKEESNK